MQDPNTVFILFTLFLTREKNNLSVKESSEPLFFIITDVRKFEVRIAG